jgi:uncharacterized protein YbjT (DUF2867 family)
MMAERILVLGATGLLGKPVADRLIADGFQVRLMVRDIEKAKGLFAESVEILEGDVTDKEALAHAMRDCMGVHISIGGDVDQISAENVAYLAPALDIERITYISGATVDEANRWFPMTAQKLNAERAIRECSVPFTFFRPTWPMEQLARFARGGKPSLIGKQPIPVHWFAAEDLARMVSIAYVTEASANKHLYVFGPEAMTMKDALERYCEVFYPEGDPVSVMPIWLAKTLGTLTGNVTLKYAANLMGYFDKIGELGDPSEANQILGAPVTTLETWMESRKA